MSGGRLEPVVEYLRRTAAAADGAGVSDADLLGRYVVGRDESAFELLVWRHARLVQGVCRRILRHEEDAQDAFQATFLVLARQARAIGRRESVGGWLYRVAYRAALRARARTVERAAREQPLGELLLDGGGPDPCAEVAGRELRAVLDEQVSRLPEKYRVVFALRCLSGKSSAEAARELGCPVGTVESRLGRARERLRAALARRGVAVPAALLAARLSGEAGATDGAAALVSCTSRAATAFAAGKAAAAGVVPARAAALAKGVLQSMFLTKLKCVAGVVLVVGTLGLAGGGITWRSEAAGQSQAAPREVQAEARQGPGGGPQEDGLGGLQGQVEERARRLRERRKVLQQIEALQRQQEELLRKLVPEQRLDVEVQRLRALGEKSRKEMPLALNDEGIVTKVAPEGLLTIGLRRESGVRLGALLHVFRLEPQPEYLGRVKVLEVVNGTAAVARVVGQVRLIRPGDRVARELTVGQAEPGARPDEKKPADSVGADSGIPERAPGALAWGKPHNGLRVGLAVEGQGGAGPRLALALENVGKDDWVVNLGVMLANGKKQYPSALRLTLTDAKGAAYNLRRTPAFVAGRVDPLLVALPAGCRYTLRYDLGDFMGEAAAPPTPGRYRAAFEFVGKAVMREETNVDTPGFALMNYWTGTVRSAAVVLTLPGGSAKREVEPGPAVPEANAPQKGKALLATLSVNHQTFMEGATDKLLLTFTLVNNDRKVIDPRIGSSKIVVNGKALADSAFILGNGPRAANSDALPPGDRLTFGYALGQHFERPGVYRVHWEGEGFLSPQIIFRVLAKPGQ